MFENDILTPGEKVAEYRATIKATQKSVAGNELTRENISNIERNKQTLTKKSAKIISKNLNLIANEKNIIIDKITHEHLLEDIDKQANRIVLNQITELQNIDNTILYKKHFSEIEILIKEYKICENNKISTYKHAADFYFGKCKYTESDEVCQIGIKICIEYNNILEEAIFYIKKSRIKLRIKFNEKALLDLEHAENLNRNINNKDISIKIYFNRAAIYMNQGMFYEAIECLKIAIQYDPEENIVVLIKMMHANCLNELNNLDDAEKEYIELLDITMKKNDKNNIAMTYRNLAEVYYKREKYEIAKKYILKSIKNNPNNTHLSENLYYAGNIYLNINIKYAEHYFLHALELLKENDKENIILIEKVIYELVRIYIRNKDEKNIEKMIEESKGLDIDNSLIFLEIAKYYTTSNNTKSGSFIDMTIDIIKKNKKM